MSLNKKQLKDVDVGGKRGIFVRVYVGGGGGVGACIRFGPLRLWKAYHNFSRGTARRE